MSYINKRAVRALALKIANNKYPLDEMPDQRVDSDGRVWNYARANKNRTKKRYTQVSAKFLEHVDLMVRNNVQSYIDKMPNKGSTIK